MSKRDLSGRDSVMINEIVWFSMFHTIGFYFILIGFDLKLLVHIKTLKGEEA